MGTQIMVQVDLCDACGKKAKDLAKLNPSNRSLVVNVFMASCATCKMKEPRVTIGPDTNG